MQNVIRRRVSIGIGLLSRFTTLLTIAFVLLLITHAQALVLHDDDDAPSASERPADNVVGRWSTNASCVAIGRADWDTTGYILTTRHQNGGVGSSVWFGGVEYVVAEVLDTNVPQERFGVGSTYYDIDMRICRLENTAANGGGKANLTDFVLWNTDTGEIGENIVMGGYGRTRGTLYYEEPDTYYYSWTGSNTTLTWGTNSIDDVVKMASSGFCSQTLQIDFDDPSTKDAAVASYDSGGGWFYQDENDDWVVAALSAYVDTKYKSYYSPTPDRNWGIRVSSYASWIDSLLEEHYEPSILGDANLDGVVGLADLTILGQHWGDTDATWYDGDFNFDGEVGLADLTILGENWGESVSMGIPVNPIPEPATLSLLGIGCLLLRRRRSFRVK